MTGDIEENKAYYIKQAAGSRQQAANSYSRPLQRDRANLQV
jgi:hypothetical protein